ncbi:MAG: type I-E CRISPR-associated endoribonuclease Cas2 [Bacillota bacterium]|nr:MAG: type I-E CRISPR-associated endoribonuclease Cas2 [Bacillota bacterium]
MTDCPPKLRGDLSKWLCEINTGVYVGHASSRVREALWERVCQNLKNGRATMVYTTNGEQKMDFRVHNTAWIPVDYDGIRLIRRPLPQAAEADDTLKPGFSKAAKRQMAQRSRQGKAQGRDTYVIIDLETTGLQSGTDAIIEFGAIKVVGGQRTEIFSRLVCSDKPLPQQITTLTGITNATLRQQGSPPEEALDAFLAFIGQEKLVGYNITFDMEFLRTACKRFGKPAPVNRCVDLLNMARRKIYGVGNYKLTTLAKHFALAYTDTHRALEDCELVWQLYCKLNE